MKLSNMLNKRAATSSQGINIFTIVVSVGFKLWHIYEEKTPESNGFVELLADQHKISQFRVHKETMGLDQIFNQESLGDNHLGILSHFFIVSLKSQVLNVQNICVYLGNPNKNISSKSALRIFTIK